MGFSNAVCSRGAPYVGCMGQSAVVGSITSGVLVGGAGSPCGWLFGLGSPGTGANPLVGR